MNITLTFIYDMDGACVIQETDSGEELVLGELDGATRCVQLQITLPDVKVDTVQVVVPDKPASDISATVEVK